MVEKVKLFTKKIHLMFETIKICLSGQFIYLSLAGSEFRKKSILLTTICADKAELLDISHV